MANEIIITKDSRPYKSLITDIGNAKMTRAVLEGRKVNIVEMRLGDGGGGYYMPTTSATALVNEVWAGEIASKTINETSPNIIAVKTVIPSSVGGFTIREASLHDDEGDMIAVCNMPDIGKATLPDGISSSLDIIMNILLTNVDAVEFVINPTLDPCSRDDLALAMAAHNADPNAHNGALRGARVAEAEIVIPASGWATDTDTGGAYALRVDIANMEITDKMIPKLSVLPLSMGAAIACRLCPTARTLDGCLRIYADAMPTAAISASLILLDTADQANDTISGSAIQVREDISIPVTGWVTDTETGGLRMDIAWAEATKKAVPDITVLPAYLEIATACGFSQLCQTMDGAVRVYAKTAPTAPIKASIALMDIVPYAANDASGAIMGIGKGITYTADGKLAAKIGDGLAFDGNGAIAVDGATLSETAAEALAGALTESDENAAKMIDEVYG